MASIIQKRRSLPNQLNLKQRENDALKSQITRLQALANLGTATCMIAHELNNLLTPLENYATLAQNNPNDRTLVNKALEKTAKNSKRASGIMQSMLALANGENIKKKYCPLKNLVEDIFDSIVRDFGKDNININIDIPPEMKVFAVPVEIQQVLMNLIFNARDAMMPNGGSLTVSAREKNSRTVIKVKDTGCGIEPRKLNKIFEPFFSTKNHHSTKLGSGLGLAFCKKIVDAYGGSINVDSQTQKGTAFTIILPGKNPGDKE